jgi:hypothetical protein
VDDKLLASPRLDSGHFKTGGVEVIMAEEQGPRLWKLSISGALAADNWPEVHTELALNDDKFEVEAWMFGNGKANQVPFKTVAVFRPAIADGNMRRMDATTTDGKHHVTLEIRVTPLPKPGRDATSAAQTVVQSGTR